MNCRQTFFSSAELLSLAGEGSHSPAYRGFFATSTASSNGFTPKLAHGNSAEKSAESGSAFPCAPTAAFIVPGPLFLRERVVLASSRRLHETGPGLHEEVTHV